MIHARNWESLCLYGWHPYMYNPQLKRWLRRITQPTLVLWGASDGIVQPRMVHTIQDVIEEEVRAGRFQSPTSPATLAYAVVRLAEAFLYNDATAALGGDVERLREVEEALLGIKPRRRSAPR